MTTAGVWQLAWSRPLRPGLPVAAAFDRCGSLGGVVFDDATGAPLLLAAQHVLCDSAGESERLWQPAPCGEPGCECNVVARPVRGLEAIRPWRGQYYYLDAGVAAIEDDVEWEPPIAAQAAAAAKGTRVYKVGSATGVTEGIVVDDRHFDNVRADGSRVGAPNQLLIRPIARHREFAALGDSGAMVCDEAGRPVGLLWGADSGGRGVACPIGPVLEALQVRLAQREA